MACRMDGEGHRSQVPARHRASIKAVLQIFATAHRLLRVYLYISMRTPALRTLHLLHLRAPRCGTRDVFASLAFFLLTAHRAVARLRFHHLARPISLFSAVGAGHRTPRRAWRAVTPRRRAQTCASCGAPGTSINRRKWCSRTGAVGVVISYGCAISYGGGARAALGGRRSMAHLTSNIFFLLSTPGAANGARRARRCRAQQTPSLLFSFT